MGQEPTNLSSPEHISVEVDGEKKQFKYECEKWNKLKWFLFKNILN